MTSSNRYFQIFQNFSILRYFSVISFHLLLSVQVFPHQNNPTFHTKHHGSFCCLSLQLIPHSDFSLPIEQHLTNMDLPTAELRATSIIAVKTSNELKPLTSATQMALCRVQNTEKVTSHSQVGQRTSSAAQRSRVGECSPHSSQQDLPPCFPFP